jgi:hypothetical protein
MKESGEYIADIVVDFKKLTNVKVIEEVSYYEDNTWEANTEFTIFSFDGGFGFADLVPDGYSSYTYDPSESRIVMFTDNYEKFIDMVLTDEHRMHLHTEPWLYRG